MMTLRKLNITLNVLLITTLLLVSMVRAQNPATELHQSRSHAITPQANNISVSGSGTVGQIPRWTGSNSSGFVLGDSIISQDKFNNIGIGTTAPTSKLTVQGMIETTLGGVKFPDGTVQTTAGLQSLFHDVTLAGNGTQASPLGVALPLTLTGTAAGDGLVLIKNTAEKGTGLNSTGGNSDSNDGGIGLFATGGNSNSGAGGVGVRAIGGQAGDGAGGDGMLVNGGFSNIGTGGAGIRAFGGKTFGGAGGVGIIAEGGDTFEPVPGGDGLVAAPGFGVPGGRAGVFNGNVEIDGDLHVTGNVSKGGGSFKIDHPLDPENKYLYHSFVESPDMMNVYNGNTTTDGNGDAVVELPDYFSTLNRDFRYQLTVIGQFAQAIVADEIKGNRFQIKTNAPNVKVSWQVTGIRQDAYANKHRIQVEVNKSEQERGFYLDPELYNQPEERGVEWAHSPQLMKQFKQHRLEAAQKRRQQQ